MLKIKIDKEHVSTDVFQDLQKAIDMYDHVPFA